ncbi:MAG: glycoside hydrolase 43 family protein, partial [Muribaculaceae bacterium]|nr:glycoside hydrolase 43 family protein [Muribaculaceae bacterium]
MKKTVIKTALLMIFAGMASGAEAYVSEVWVADKGNGRYVNPIINADYSDPDVVEVDGEYYMTASSFSQSPGLPILHSTDLVNWEIVNNALPVLEPADFYAVPRHGKGVWAPSIRYHNGEFYIYYGDPDFGIYMVKTRNPRGEWEKPVLVKGYKGIIDTTPLWDDDGRAYMVNAWAASRSGMNSILTVTEMNPEGTELIGDPVIVFDGNDGVNHTVEGPKFYKRDGWYYILAPAGGVDKGWQLAMRSKSPFGPYE